MKVRHGPPGNKSGPVGKACPRDRRWDGRKVRSLRRQLGLTQAEMAAELGVRQQTVSDWEVGAYQPRGASCTVLEMVAERARSRYQASP